MGKIISESLVIATGGLSIPTLSATDFGYGVARKFGLAIKNLGALVPHTFKASADRIHFSEWDLS